MRPTLADASLPAQGRLNQLLRYEPETGRLFWKARSPSDFKDGKNSAEHNAKKWNARFAEAEAFTTALPLGHRYSSIDAVKMYAHRVIWKMVFGEDADDIDHINGDPADNRLENLRNVSHQTNGRNMRRSKANSSGHVGVSYFPKTDRWHARICVDGRTLFLGSFGDISAAIAARVAANGRHNFHENHGRP